MSSLLAPANWPFLAVILLFSLLLVADLGSRRARRKQDKEQDGDDSLLEEQLNDLQYLHRRVREEDFRRAMFEQHQAMLDRSDAVLDKERLGISVEHLMTSRVLSVLPDTSREDVAAAMESIGSRHIIVCDERDRLLGVISDRDLKGREGAAASEIMTPSAYSVGPRTSTAHALALMQRHRISCLPVVDDREQLVGVLTTSDLLLALSCYLELSAMLCSPPASRAALTAQRRARSLRESARVGQPEARFALAGCGGRALLPAETAPAV